MDEDTKKEEEQNDAEVSQESVEANPVQEDEEKVGE